MAAAAKDILRLSGFLGAATAAGRSRDFMQPTLRDDPFITFAPRGGEGVQKLLKFANDSTDRLREMRTKGREGV